MPQTVSGRRGDEKLYRNPTPQLPNPGPVGRKEQSEICRYDFEVAIRVRQLSAASLAALR